MGHRRPHRRGRKAGFGARRVKYTDDSGRPLVACRLHAEPREQGRIGCVAAHRDRPRMRNVAEQCAERDDELHAEGLGELDDLRGEGWPAHRWLDPAHQDQVARRARRAASRTSTAGHSSCRRSSSSRRIVGRALW